MALGIQRFRLRLLGAKRRINARQMPYKLISIQVNSMITDAKFQLNQSEMSNKHEPIKLAHEKDNAIAEILFVCSKK